MTKTWVYSDPHFYHNNIVKFTNYDGTKVRPLWDCAEKMTEDLIEWYNELVDDRDRVYILGDVAFSPTNIRRAVERMKGRKVLVPGNHEPVKMRKYFDLFDDVRGYVVKKGFIMSHIPLHPSCLGRWDLNIHGHLHGNKITTGVHPDLDYEDKRYRNVCVEQTNWRPIELDVVLKEAGLKQQ